MFRRVLGSVSRRRLAAPPVHARCRPRARHAIWRAAAGAARRGSRCSTVAVLALGIGATTGIYSVDGCVADAPVAVSRAGADRAAVRSARRRTRRSRRRGAGQLHRLASAGSAARMLAGRRTVWLHLYRATASRSRCRACASAGLLRELRHGADARPHVHRRGVHRRPQSGRRCSATARGSCASARDRGIVGRAIRLNGQPYTIVGVMPPAFAPRLLVTFSERGVWTPKVWAEFEQRLRGSRYYNAVARLKPGVTIEQAQAELDGSGRTARAAISPDESGKVIQLVSLRDHLAGDLRAVGRRAGWAPSSCCCSSRWPTPPTC